MTLVARHGAHTDVGLHRPGNEDRFEVRDDLFLVADGMGGAQAGEVASELAARTVAERVSAGATLADAAVAANTAVHDAAVADPGRGGMGTTLTVARLHGDELELAHVGDSRAYLLHDGELERVTQDHSLVSQWVREGAITADEAAKSKYRNVLTRALGTEAQVEVDAFAVPVAAGDVLLLCSDGLHGLVADERLAALLATAAADPGACARSLVNEAKREGGHDNITAVVVVFESGPESGADTVPATDAVRSAGAASRAETAAGAGSAGETTPGDPPAGRAAKRPPADPEVAAPLSHAAAARISVESVPDPRHRRHRLLAMVMLGLALLVLLALVAGLVVFSQSYYVGVDDGYVAVYRGLPYAPLGIKLHRVYLRTTLPYAAAPYDLRPRLDAHDVTGKDDALQLVKEAGGEP